MAARELRPGLSPTPAAIWPAAVRASAPAPCPAPATAGAGGRARLRDEEAADEARPPPHGEAVLLRREGLGGVDLKRWKKRMVRSEGFASDEVVDRHGLTDIGGPLFVGGVSFLTPATGLFTDSRMLRRLRTEQSFQDYLEIREEAFKLAMQQMVAACDSPIDLIIQTERDEKLFRNHFFKLLALRDQYSVIVDEASRAENLSPHRTYSEDELNHIRCKNDKDALLKKLHGVRRYYAYRKSLLEHDFIKWNSDPEEVLKWIKESTGWSVLDDYELRLGLEAHLELLKGHVSELGSTSTSSSMSDEFKNVALEEINSTLSSELEKHLQIPDMWLMQEYFNRVKIRNLARECSKQAEKTGVILVEEFIPKRHLEEQVLPKRLPLNLRQQMKQRVKQSLESAKRYLRRHGSPRARTLTALGFGAVLSYSMPDEYGLETVN